MRKRKKDNKIYLCGNDLYDLFAGLQCDIKMYPTLKQLKEKRHCLDECGIISVELKNARVIKKGKYCLIDVEKFNKG